MNFVIKNILILISAMVASIGTYPYAKNFANYIFISTNFLFLAKILIVSAALFANIALGTFSIIETFEISKKTTLARLILIGGISLFAAIATGFICVMGYYDTLSLHINISISIMVTLVNTAICFSAVHHTSLHFFTKKNNEIPLEKCKKFLIITIMLLAFLTSFVFYLATFNGIMSVINTYHIFNEHKRIFAHLTSFLVWVPSAALFVNASRITLLKIYNKCRSKDFSCSRISFLIIIIAFFSGSAYAQMTMEFFDTSKQIPVIFQIIASKNNLVIYGIMPVAFVISGLVNAYALNSIFAKYKSQPNGKQYCGDSSQAC